MRKNTIYQIPICIVLGFILAYTQVLASSGDESSNFGRCVYNCVNAGCAKATVDSLTETCSSLCPEDSNTTNIVPWTLFLTGWDCTADCNYLCMWEIEEAKKLPQLEETAIVQGPFVVEKYFGKWPFVRVLGMQEPASVVLSLANMAAVLHCYHLLSSTLMNMRQEPAYSSLWLTHMKLSANAWLWSAVFHTRDTKPTEKLDYFSAGAVITFNLYLTIVRTLAIRNKSQRDILGGALAFLYTIHMLHMTYVLFDYGWHVTLCVVAGAVQSVLWLIWAFTKGKDHPGKKALLLFVVAVNAAVLLEILDFPPLFHTLDAHSLWHATTVPLTYLWYWFVDADVHYVGKEKKRREPSLGLRSLEMNRSPRKTLSSPVKSPLKWSLTPR